MKKVVLGTVAAIVMGPAFAEVTRTQHPTEFVVKFKEGAQKELGASWLKSAKTKTLSRSGVQLVSLPSMVKSAEALKAVSANANIEWAYPNYIYEGDAREGFEPNDPEFSKQRHHIIMKSSEAWDLNQGTEQIVVAVPDDGFDLTHPDMQGSYFVNEGEIAGNGIDDDQNGYIDDVSGWSFTNDDNNPSTMGGHGTHVAGIIAAGFNDGVGVTGIAPNVKVMPLHFYGGRRGWTSALIYETYSYAADNGAHIITTSYNIDGFARDEVFARALDYLDSKGVIQFNSAGNGNAHQSARTKFSKTILVASTKTAVGSEDARSSFSNYGVDVDIAAPGDPVYSHAPRGRYTNMSGTSMAAPNAAAIAAYIWSVFPEYTREQVVHKLLTSSDDIDGINTSYAKKLGAGRVNALNAISESVGLTTVRQAWLENGQLNLHVRGLIASGLGRGAVTVERLSQRGSEVVEIETMEKMDLAQSVLKFRLTGTTPGQYRVRVSSELLSDPFGRAIDGDNDGVEGGDFVQVLSL